MGNEMITEEQFMKELTELAETLANEGKPAAKALLQSMHFLSWPRHLQLDALERLELEPVQMYRRLK